MSELASLGAAVREGAAANTGAQKGGGEMHRDSTWLIARRLRWALAGVLAGALALGCAGGTSGGAGLAPASDSATSADTAAAADGVAGDAVLGSDGSAADSAADDTAVAAADVVADDVAADDVAAADAEPDAPLCSSLATSGEPKALEPLLAAAHVLDHTGAPVDVDVVKGKWTVIWFYPAAQTAG